MTPASGKHEHVGLRWRGAVVPFALLAAWQLAALANENSFIFVSFATVAKTFWEVASSGELELSVLASLRKASLALVLGTTSGVLVGSGMAAWRALDRAAGPTLHALRQVPVLGLAPLIGLWLGSGEPAKVVLVFLSVFYPVMLSSYAGVKNVDVRLLEVARVYDLDRWQTFQKLLLPALSPFLLTGISHAVAFSWIATVGSEMLLSAGSGIGNMMLRAQAGGRMDIVIVCVLSVLSMSMLIDNTVRRLGLRTTRWQDTAEVGR